MMRLLFRRAVCLLFFARVVVGCGASSQPVATSRPPTAAPAVAADVACPDALVPLSSPIVAGFGANVDLWLLNADGSAAAQLTALPPTSAISHPAWSPALATLAYSLIVPSADPLLPWLQTGVICGFDRATGTGRLLVRGNVGETLSEPSWLPDATGLIVTRRRVLLDAQKQFQGEDVALVRYALAGGEPQVVVANATTPAIAPDGTRLAYVSPNQQTGFPALMIAALDGSDPQLLGVPEPPFKSINQPRWSPDGKNIVFSARGGPGSLGGAAPARSWLARLFGVGTAAAHGEPGSLWLVGADGQQLRPLIPTADDPLATWHPDSTTLLYSDWTNGLALLNPQDADTTALASAEQFWALEWSSH